MLVSHREEFIYTKTYKTASTSIEVLFEPYCLPEGEAELSHERDEKVTKAGIVGCRGCDGKHAKWYNHMPAYEIKKKIDRKSWNSYYKFCGVRNPFDKAVSMYNDVRSSRSKGYINGILRGKVASQNTYLLKKDFERFVKTFKSDKSKYVIDGQLCVDAVIFFESLKHDIDKIAKAIGLNTSHAMLPRLKSKNRINEYESYRYYNEDSKRYIKEEFEFEINTFGYTFPEPGKASSPAESKKKKFTPSVKKAS